MVNRWIICSVVVHGGELRVQGICVGALFQPFLAEIWDVLVKRCIQLAKLFIDPILHIARHGAGHIHGCIRGCSGRGVVGGDGERSGCGDGGGGGRERDGLDFLGGFPGPGLGDDERGDGAREVHLGGGRALEAHHGGVVGPRGHLRRGEGPQPDARLRDGVADLRDPLPPHPHSHAPVCGRRQAMAVQSSGLLRDGSFQRPQQVPSSLDLHGNDRLPLLHHTLSCSIAHENKTSSTSLRQARMCVVVRQAWIAQRP
jgi:hypothetical protein